MIIVHGAIELDPNHWEEAMELSLAHVERSRLEPGCISHAVHIDAENPNRLVFFEEWQDMEALHAHFRVPASADFIRRLEDLATSKPDMRIFRSERSG